MAEPQIPQPWWNRDSVRGSRALILSSLAFSLMTVCVKQLNSRLSDDGVHGTLRLRRMDRW